MLKSSAMICLVLMLLGCTTKVTNIDPAKKHLGVAQVHMERSKSQINFMHSQYIGVFDQIESESGERLLKDLRLLKNFEYVRSVDLTPGTYTIRANCGANGGHQATLGFRWHPTIRVTLENGDSVTLACEKYMSNVRKRLYVGKGRSRYTYKAMRLIELGRNSIGEPRFQRPPNRQP